MSDDKKIGVFFDLDKTLIHGATLLIFAPTLYRNKLINGRTLVRAGVGAKIFDKFGANEKRMATMKRVGLKIADGWNHGDVVKIVEDKIEALIGPRVYKEAKEAIAHHKAQGHIITIVSSSPIELVEPIAKLLGIDNIIATRIKLDENGFCTKEFELYVYGLSKPEEIRRLALELDIDLTRSFAYSDSITDLPLLQSVQFPTVVNPDKKLAAHAIANGWEVKTFLRPDDLGESFVNRATDNHWVQASAGIVGATIAGISALAINRKFNPPQIAQVPATLSV